METADAANQAESQAESQAEQPQPAQPNGGTGGEPVSELGGEPDEELMDELTMEEETQREEFEAEVVPDAVQLAIAAGGALLAGLLYLILPSYLSPGPNWVPLLLEVVLLGPSLVAILLLERRLPYRIARGLALALLGVLTVALISSVVLLTLNLLRMFGLPGEPGPNLLRDGAVLWAINILVFAVWYWEVDGEGPLSRVQAPYLSADFQFPQQENDNPTRWVPGFVDYLFLAFCFSTALSPADTPPLSRRAKSLMMAQAAVSLTIIVLLVGRSVNILPQGG